MGDVVCLKDFASLQAAVDAVPENGTLFVPPGKWACGSAKLKSNIYWCHSTQTIVYYNFTIKSFCFIGLP